MKYTTLLISLAVLLFCCLASINSQRSLYDDVQLLRQVESIQTPTVTFDFQEPDSVDFSCTFYGGKAYFPFEQHTPIPIVYNGVFNFNFAKVKLGDKITFSLSDTVFTLVYPTGASNDQLWDEEVSRWRLQLALSSDYSSISYTDVMKKDSILYESEGQNYFEKVKKAELILFGQELSNRLRNGQYNIDEEVVEGPLQRNPFLGELLFSNRTDRSISYYAPAYRATTDPDIFLADYYQTYPHQRIIDGDSLLDFRQNLALTSTASSYRSQIVTAQDQLRQASTAINENRQRSSGFSATNVAVGLSDFIAERAQEELNLSFFNRFKENLARKSELTVLFPATSDLMFKFEISNYKTFLNFARETFQNDLDNLGLNVPGILNLEKYKKLKNDPNVFNLSLIYSVADLAYREQPVETILLASLQTLQQRREYLNQSISLAITDSMLTLQQNDDRPSPLVQYRDDLLGYLKEIEALDQQLRGNKDILRAW